MPLYAYTGLNDKGKKAQGVIDGENEKAARAKLRKSGIFPTIMRVAGAGETGQGFSLNANVDFKKIFNRIRLKDVAMLTRQLATLLTANIPLVDALQAMLEQIEKENVRTVVADLRERVTEGGRLSDAMKNHPKVFDDLYVNMVSAGENSGSLDLVLMRLADFIEKQQQIRAKITGAMVYPLIMVVIGIALLSVLFIFMIPQMVEIFNTQKMTLPFSTRILIFVSTVMSGYWYLVVAMMAGAAFFFHRWFKKPKGKAWRDQMMLKLPLFGNLIRITSISRFTRTLSTLLASGVPMLQSMGIVKNVIRNVHIRQAVESTQTSVKEGESVAEPLRRSGQFPPLVTHMIAIGEKTGALEKMLERVSDSYDLQADNTISTLLSLVEPVMILGMGLAIGFVAISIMLPILEMGNLSGL